MMYMKWAVGAPCVRAGGGFCIVRTKYDHRDAVDTATDFKQVILSCQISFA